MDEYITIGQERLERTLCGVIRYRPYDKPIYNAKNSVFQKFLMNGKKVDNLES